MVCDANCYLVGNINETTVSVPSIPGTQDSFSLRSQQSSEEAMNDTTLPAPTNNINQTSNENLPFFKGTMRRTEQTYANEMHRS